MDHWSVQLPHWEMDVTCARWGCTLPENISLQFRCALGDQRLNSQVLVADQSTLPVVTGTATVAIPGQVRTGHSHSHSGSFGAGLSYALYVDHTVKMTYSRRFNWLLVGTSWTEHIIPVLKQLHQFKALVWPLKLFNSLGPLLTERASPPTWSYLDTSRHYKAFCGCHVHLRLSRCTLRKNFLSDTNILEIPH